MRDDEQLIPDDALTVVDVLGADGVAPDPARDRGAVKRLLTGDGANLITFSFAPGQSWPDHQAAHPITVQCLAGTLDFTVGKRTVRLDPGVVVHLKERVLHRVDCPADAADPVNVLLLTMLTGERH
ncbi:cupin domain-containing protein [Micrococcus terreus]|uniref:cupin domain-containing protein n=1 Tax=Micrococcus terreus TaxID=574650 RepID=UPI0023F88CCB|nr:cupin domain-containing protein [Micrococcus terreus]